MNIQITTGDVTIKAQIFDTPTGKVIAKALPLTGAVNRWGGEIYFSIPVSAELEPNSREVVKAGELAYWPPGKAFCIFFGPTPASQSNECRPASAVNVFGKISGDLSGLWNVQNGASVSVTAS